MTLQYFPRGGKKPTKGATANVTKNANEKKIKRSKKQRTGKTNAHFETAKEEPNIVANIAERLSSRSIQESMIILGRVREATEYNLTICLPGGINARVPVTNIHESYNRLLQDIVKSETELPSDFKPLSELYPVGEYVVCYIKAVKPNAKWALEISLDPSLINQNIDGVYLTKDTKIVCTVTSKEDHGYVVDTGIRNVRAFIPFRNIEPEKEYFTGRQLLCAIKNIKTIESNLIITLSTKQKRVNKPSTCEEKSLDVLMPGINLQLRIEKILSNGIQVSFGENNVGYINQIYLDNSLSSYSVGTEITGTLMYIMPTVKFAYFTLLVHHEVKGKLDVGKIIPKATVLFRESNGIVFKLKNNLRGFVAMYRTDVDYTHIATKFKEGSRHNCRILAYDMLEKLYICTTQREMLERKYFALSDFAAGDIVNVTVQNINTESNSLKVAVNKIYGFVFSEHLSDHGPSVLKKLKIGQQVTARVLNVDTQQNRIIYTLKQSLIQSNLPILQNIDEAQCGSLHHGTIVQINKNGLLVRFFGDVKGWVSHNHLKKGAAKANWGYTIGETIMVKIESVKKAEQKMLLSIVKEENSNTNSENFTIGQSVEGIVVDSGTEGVYLKIKKDGEEDTETGFLPAGHMAPCPEIARLLASRCTPGDVMSALVFATMPTLLLTRTFVSEEAYRNFDSLKIGDCIPCSIRDISQDGIRVILPIRDYSTFGFVSYNHVSNVDSLSVNQIVFAKITNINKQERQLSLTLSFHKVWADETEERSKMMASIDSLSLYFNKLSELSQNFYYKDRPISSIHLGQRVTGDVEKITDFGIIIKLENNVQGTVRKDHCTKDIKVGDTVSGAVIWINYVHEFVDLTLIPKLINNISTKQDKLPLLPSETLLRGEIIMITNWFILVNLKGHGRSLVALPARRHINDIQPDLTPYTVWSKLRCYVILNRGEADIMPICMLKSAFDTLQKHSARLHAEKVLKGSDSEDEIVNTIEQSLKHQIEHEDTNEINKRKRFKKELNLKKLENTTS